MPEKPLFSNWKGRLRGALLDLAILYIAAYHPKEVYPYSVMKELKQSWGEDVTPPLPTIYSTIDRLVKSNYLTERAVSSSGRMKKMLVITESGFLILQEMIVELRKFLQLFELYDKELNIEMIKRRFEIE